MPILRILCLNIGQRRPEDEMPKWGSYFGPIPNVERKHMNKGALAGIRIADFSWAWAGSYATELLAFLGAEVIKIESMRRPDHTRIRAFTTGQLFESLDQSYVFNHINLNKTSIRINLSKAKGIDLAKRLVGMSDVVAQNMRPGVMDRLGLGYEALKEVKSDIIYLSSSTRGSSGPEKGYAGYAPNFGALGGISYITGYENGPPSYMRGEMDLLSAITGTFAVLAANHHRLETGEGQHIDLSSSEAINSLIGEILVDYTMNGRVQSPQGNQDEIMAPHNCYRCKGEDKWVSIAISDEEEWGAFCKAMGHPPWSAEQRFSTALDRWENQEEMDGFIEKWTTNYTHYEVMEILQNAGVAGIPSFNAEELMNDPHLAERNCWQEVDHPVMGKQAVVAPPWRLSDTPARITGPAPLFGEHSLSVFQELLGLSSEEIAGLEEEEVIY